MFAVKFVVIKSRSISPCFYQHPAVQHSPPPPVPFSPRRHHSSSPPRRLHFLDLLAHAQRERPTSPNLSFAAQPTRATLPIGHHPITTSSKHHQQPRERRHRHRHRPPSLVHRCHNAPQARASQGVAEKKKFGTLLAVSRFEVLVSTVGPLKNLENFASCTFPRDAADLF
jgi:hypothetical protein